MKIEAFAEEVRRLKVRFGAEQFDQEFQKLIWAEVRDLPDECMKKIANHCIGEFRPDWPPRLSDIRTFAEEQRKAYKSRELEKAKEVLGSKVQTNAASGEGLQKLLREKNANSILDLIYKNGSKT